MKTIFSYSIILIVAAVFVYSCSDKFLEIPAQNALSESNLTDQNGIEAALIAAYSMLDGFANNGNPWGGQQSNYLWGDILSDDAYKGSEPTDFPDWEVFEKFTWQPSFNELNNKFTADYEGIARANAAIKLAQSGEISDDVKNRIIGEGRFLRAHFHFDAYKMFKYIPYYTEEDEDYKKSNQTEGGEFIDPIDNIIADFQAAADALPLTQSQVGRVTKEGALAYLGKAYLYNKQYAEAKAALDQVVNGTTYKLQDCYHSVFSVPGENGDKSGRESLFSYQASVNDGSSDGQNANHLERLTFAHGGSPFGCCGVRQPSQNLVNAYKVDSDGLPLFDSFNDTELSPSDPVDPRLDWVVARPGVPVLNYYKEGEDGENSLAYSTGWVRAPAYGGPYSNKKVMYHYGQDEESTVGWVNTHLSALNVHLLRMADVILMLAEAEVELNNLERARELVNMVRDRASNCAQGPPNDLSTFMVPIDDPSITWANYQVGTYDNAWTDKEYARRAVQWERRLELAMEGHRFFDLRRWGIAKEVMNKYMAEEVSRRSYLANYQQYQDKHDLYPLPQIQLDLSKKGGVQQLKQVPGWN